MLTLEMWNLILLVGDQFFWLRIVADIVLAEIKHIVDINLGEILIKSDSDSKSPPFRLQVGKKHDVIFNFCSFKFVTIYVTDEIIELDLLYSLVVPK
nr:hypothetical protein [Tanacetum cinerariifolium]